MQETQTGWYLVYTKPRHETHANTHLHNQGFRTYLPLLPQYKKRRNIYQVITEPLFPRYLFIYLKLSIDDWSKIRSTRGCLSLVRFGMTPAHVPHTLIDYLKAEEVKRQMHPSSAPLFKPGDHVRVSDGLLNGYEGIIETKSSNQRITLLLTVSEQYTRRIEVSINQVEKLDARIK